MNPKSTHYLAHSAQKNITLKSALKHTLSQVVLGSLLLGSVNAVAASASEEDPYIRGFKTYANEINTGSGNLKKAAETYADEVFKTERSVGYIGQELPIPQAIKVTNGVYTVVGSMIWHTPDNFGLNNNLSFMIFKDGVFVFNAGANPAIAYSLHKQIKRMTDKPVKWVAVENSQGHAYLGSSYWVDVGVKNLYSSTLANQQFHDGYAEIKEEWASRVGRDITKTARDVSDKFTTYDNELSIDVGGGETVLLKDFGPGHTPASTSVYVPSKKVILTGDLGFNERMPVFFAYTDSFAWKASYKRMLDEIPADTLVVPGHGTPTDMATGKRQMHDYLDYMHTQIQKIVDADGTEEQALLVDQSMYKDRPVFDQAAPNNAQHIYREITGGSFK
jgi:glyoxylase-like metal-dependent hydrolase (beta-lactamase superfamily II)